MKYCVQLQYQELKRVFYFLRVALYEIDGGKQIDTIAYQSVALRDIISSNRVDINST